MYSKIPTGNYTPLSKVGESLIWNIYVTERIYIKVKIFLILNSYISIILIISFIIVKIIIKLDN